MIAELNRKSLYIGGAGLFLQMIGAMLLNIVEILPVILVSVGLILLIIGVLFLLQSKGRHWAWVFFLILGILGLLIIYLISDYNKEGNKW